MCSIDQHERCLYKCEGPDFIRRDILRRMSHIFLKRKKIDLDESTINILFVLFGGLGDLVINRNYLLHLKTFLNDNKIKFYVTSDRDQKVLSSLICDKDIELIRLSDEYSFKNFDAIIRMIRYPVIISCKTKKIKKDAKLLEYVQANYRFQQEFAEILGNHPYSDHDAMVKCISEDKDRIQQPDFTGNLDLKKLEGYRIQCTDTELLELGLNKPYITINRDSGWANLLKLWPADRYKQLITRIKNDFPEIQIVTIGEKIDDDLRGMADVDLVGKTDMEQLKAVLNNSLLHITSEGFTAHLRHFMSSKPSVVFFGPTLESFYGYPENINFSPCNTECWCEWKNCNWNLKCIKGTRTCLEEIPVEEVYNAIHERLLNIVNK